MELQSDDRMTAMRQSHDLAFLAFRCDYKIFGQIALGNDQGVVACRPQWIWQSGKDTAAGMPDHRRLAMHRPPGANDPAAKGLAYALMAEADAENWNGRSEAPHRRHGDPGLIGCARAWRDDDMGRF